MSDIVTLLREAAFTVRPALAIRAADIIERHRKAFRAEAEEFGHSPEDIDAMLALLEAGAEV